MSETVQRIIGRLIGSMLLLIMVAGAPAVAHAQVGQTAAGTQEVAHHGEANLVLPDLSTVDFHGINGRTLLMGGLVVCALGLLFGLMTFTQLKNLPVHASMREVSELIYETCKTYLVTQGKFILLLEVFIGVIMVFYFGVLQASSRSASSSSCSSVSSASPAATASRGSASASTRSPTRAPRSRACAASRFPIYAIPLRSGMSIGMLLISVELLLMLCILLFIPGNLAGACFIGFAIGESLGAAALRIAGGIFTKIADIGSDLMKIVFNIKEDDARNPGVIADCTGDNAGRLGRPERRRLRDLRRDRRRADLVHRARGARRERAGAAARVDLRDAHHDDRRERPVVFHQRERGEGPVRATSTR